MFCKKNFLLAKTQKSLQTATKTNRSEELVKSFFYLLRERETLMISMVSGFFDKIDREICNKKEFS